MSVPVLPFSPSSLDTFVNCGWMYHERYISKRTKKVGTVAKDWGNTVHKTFEDYLDGDGATPLPPTLMEHTPFLEKVRSWDGMLFTEMEGALDRNLLPVSNWFERDVFCRCKIDVLKVTRGGPQAWLVDWKTGRPHDKWKQLALNAIMVFRIFPHVDIVDARYYWLQTGTPTRKVWSRAEEASLWDMILPDLRQYRQAFRDDVWQKRPSGLCNGHCEVTDCEHWRPLRPRR